MSTTDDDFSRRMDHQWAIEEHRFYKEHGRPSKPYYQICYRCNESWKLDGSLLDADHDVRYHAGYHAGLKNERAQIVVTDATGVEIFRIHGGHTFDEAKIETCPVCDTETEDGRITCPECGHIPEEHLLK